MDKSKGSLIVKFSGKETLNLTILSKVCSCLTNVLNKISLVSSNSKNDYSVSYNTGDGFSFVITQDKSEDANMIDENINVFNTLIDILCIRRFVTKNGTFKVTNSDDLVEISNDMDSETFDSLSYSIYSSDNVIEDNLSKLSSIIASNKNSFQVVYKNGILEKRVNYSKEDLVNTSKKLDLEALNSSKEEYLSTMSLQVEQLDLSGSGNWKFKDVSNFKSFKAKIKDREFCKDLKSGNVVIGYGLIIKGEVKTTVIKDKYGKIATNKSSYVIEKVHDVLYSTQSDNTVLNIE